MSKNPAEQHSWHPCLHWTPCFDAASEKTLLDRSRNCAYLFIILFIHITPFMQEWWELYVFEGLFVNMWMYLDGFITEALVDN